MSFEPELVGTGVGGARTSIARAISSDGNITDNKFRQKDDGQGSDGGDCSRKGGLWDGAPGR